MPVEVQLSAVTDGRLVVSAVNRHARSRRGCQLGRAGDGTRSRFESLLIGRVGVAKVSRENAGVSGQPTSLATGKSGSM